MKEVFEALLAHMDRGEGCMLVSAVGGEGSAPRKTQSHMLVDARGRVLGTVGGGAVEGNSILYAQELLAQRASAMREYALHERAKNDIGMICGGRVSIHFQWAAPEDASLRAIAQAAVSALAAGRDAWLVIDVGRHSLALCDGERQIGPDIPQEVVRGLGAGAFVCRTAQSQYYAEQLAYSDRVYVFGGGHVAQALVPMLAAVDFRCVVVEDREEFCNRSLFPQAQDVLLLTRQDWETALHISDADCICIMTRGHQNDLACQAFALQTQAGYIGVIGSRRKIAAVNEKLRAMGFDDEQISRIVTPIGLEIGAITPAEIAVSITAQMIAHRAGKRKNSIPKSCMS